MHTRVIDDGALEAWLVRRAQRLAEPATAVELDDQDPDTDEIVPARQPARPLTMWVLDGDPAVDRPGVLGALDRLCKKCTIDVIPSDDRDRYVGALRDGTVRPDVLVFGDLHVILQDGVLIELCHVDTTRRVLLSTHHNDDLVELADALCVVNHHLVVARDADTMASELSRVTGVPLDPIAQTAS
ncbi:MAG: hypothetical protein H6733_14170 [Alphaproteobacteria bacterium]|nr:hypothetical protein [Alphaproteobacteria bacterium]